MDGVGSDATGDTATLDRISVGGGSTFALAGTAGVLLAGNGETGGAIIEGAIFVSMAERFAVVSGDVGRLPVPTVSVAFECG